MNFLEVLAQQVVVLDGATGTMIQNLELDDLILKLRDSMNMTIVVVTHELESAFKIADRITVLDNGKILLTGSVAEVKNSSIQRVQDLLNRRSRDEEINAEEYMDRLTGSA